MDRMEILKSATSHIAKAYKLDAEIGTLEPGKIADLVILDAIRWRVRATIASIHAVIKDGKLVDRDALPVAPIIELGESASSMKVLSRRASRRCDI